ncbi:MAG: hypothetical protein PHU51_00190 [Candidatus Nanoarchaeia archaeon]|nr:hypothetical protein [Candidatus Nanoarchaeia archaeon]
MNQFSYSLMWLILIIISASSINATKCEIDFLDSPLTIYSLEQPKTTNWIYLDIEQNSLQITQSNNYLSPIQILNLKEYFNQNIEQIEQDILLTELIQSIEEILIANNQLSITTNQDIEEQTQTYNQPTTELKTTNILLMTTLSILILLLIFLLFKLFKLNKKQPTINLQLKEYVRSLLSQGYSQVDIKNNLISQGYPQKEIEQIFQALK